MTKRFLLSGFLFFSLCVFVCSAVKAQDTTKKAEPEKKVEPTIQSLLYNQRQSLFTVVTAYHLLSTHRLQQQKTPCSSRQQKLLSK